MSEHRVEAPMACTVVELHTAPGRAVHAGQALLVVEAMKMEHEIRAPADGVVLALPVEPGATVAAGELLVALRATAAPADAAPAGEAADRRPGAAFGESSPRADLLALRARQAWTEDAQRPDAVAKRHAAGRLTAREIVARLCDADSFSEYGALAIAAQTRRRGVDELIRQTPADGLVGGTARINGALFGEAAARSVVLAYDATVLAGTQGMRNHQKTDRLLDIAWRERLPVVWWAEGGGGRPGDVDMPIVAGLHVTTFAAQARLSGRVPLVGVVSGRCFAGNAALLGCCDVIIATRASTIGMAGPAMIEGGGLGVVGAEQVGPSHVQRANGVIDVLVEDDAQAVDAARRYLGYFQGRLARWEADDALALRDALPANRVRAYDVRDVMRRVADAGTLLELRDGFGLAVRTALARVEGVPVGLMASNPMHLGGAIDADAADKAARFLQLCDAHGLPVVSLIDTPGFMVGPDAEARAQVRHASRLFVVGAQLRVPLLALVLRKGYGLGAMALAGGGFHAPLAIAAWPSGEFGAMGLEGAVRLGYRRELEAVPEGPLRDQRFRELVERQYAQGSAIEMAATLEIDAVIDPADTRRWLARGLAAARPAAPEARGRFIDPW